MHQGQSRRNAVMHRKAGGYSVIPKYGITGVIPSGEIPA
jgi:hypothetical protein